jgi:GH15 family glucan-1,4-alpha-glucosidase
MMLFLEDPFVQTGIRTITENQAESGAYYASPNFPTYRYCWFRDSSYIAYSMNLCAVHQSAARFHQWTAGVVNRRADLIHRTICKVQASETLTEADVLHTRYTVDGHEGTLQKWENFQLDGFGTWLWSLNQHLLLSGQSLPQAILDAAGLVAAYLEALWQHPCYDCWEERLDNIHPHTLAAIYGGLLAYSEMTGKDTASTTAAIRSYLYANAVQDGHWVKFIGTDWVDASLIGLAVPYRVCEPSDPIMQSTIARIESDLRVDGGGVHRYPSDEYYGGGEWCLLTSWLGWYYAETGQKDRANDLHTWVKNQADEHGWLPEQVPQHLNRPDSYAPWLNKWGEIANPLLWSHAMYIILQKALM